MSLFTGSLTPFSYIVTSLVDIQFFLTFLYLLPFVFISLDSKNFLNLCFYSVFKNLFNWKLITILWWFFPHIDMNQPRVHMCAPSWTPLPPASPSHPSGLSQCTGFECPVSCIQCGLVIYYNMVIHMFQSYSLKSSHLCFLPQSPKVCSLHLCLFCCLTYRVIVTIFLNSIYMC